MTLSDSTIIIADDLTGADDTSAQYFQNGYSARVVMSLDNIKADENIDVWAISTESRNTDKETAVSRVKSACDTLSYTLGIENFYKKIDSTLRGNVGLEILVTMECAKKELAIVAPAYIEEGRATIGGYQLLNGVVIERTQCALDPKAPIYSSYIPDILKKDLNPDLYNLIDTINFNTISKGAGPIKLKIKELFEKGKRILVLDAMSLVDLEQIALAIQKSEFDILPVGSAGLANAINKVLGPKQDMKSSAILKKLPRFLVSGSATQLTHNQIKKLKTEKPDILYIDLKTKDVLSEPKPELVQEIISALKSNRDVVLHTSKIEEEIEEESIEEGSEKSAKDLLIDAGIAKNEFSDKITEFLSDTVELVEKDCEFVLIVTGGESAFKCAQKIDADYLEIKDTIMSNIPLSFDPKGRAIITKSGNFGSNSAFVEIIDYLDKLQNEKL